MDISQSKFSKILKIKICKRKKYLFVYFYLLHDQLYVLTQKKEDASPLYSAKLFP